MPDHAAVCDVATRVIVVGTSNDIELNRQLARRGISEYLRAPIEPMALVGAIADAFDQPGSSKLGRLYVHGRAGGVGSSTIAHNAAATLCRCSGGDDMLLDMDLAFGTANLNFGVEPAGNIGHAVRDVGRLDEQVLDRLLALCDEPFSLLGETFAVKLKSRPWKAPVIPFHHARAPPIRYRARSGRSSAACESPKQRIAQGCLGFHFPR